MPFNAQAYPSNWSGIGDFGRSIGDALAKIGEKKKEEVRLTKTLRTLLPQLGVDEHTVNTADLGTLNGLLLGVTERQKQEQQQAVIRWHAAQTAQLEGADARRKSEQAAFGGALRQLVTDGNLPPELATTLEQPGLTPEAAGEIMRTYRLLNPPVEAEKPEPESLPIGESVTLPDGAIIYGKGRGHTPELRTPKDDKPTRVGLPLGEKMEVPGVGVIVGMGENAAPHVVPFNDVQAMEDLKNRNKGSQPTPTDKDIEYLKRHPELKAKFEGKYGAGSAAKYIK